MFSVRVRVRVRVFIRNRVAQGDPVVLVMFRKLQLAQDKAARCCAVGVMVMQWIAQVMAARSAGEGGERSSERAREAPLRRGRKAGPLWSCLLYG